MRCNITEVAIHRLEQQLGKPYIWGVFSLRCDCGFQLEAALTQIAEEGHLPDASVDQPLLCRQHV